jgi:hypothetical protein
MTMSNQPVPQLGLKLTYEDRPGIAETYVDSLEKLMLEGPIARLEFVVNRLDEPKPPRPPSGKKQTAARIVMPIPAFVEMFGKMNGMMQLLMQQGLIQPIPVAPTPSAGKPN